MAEFNAQKADKLTIEEVARQQLDGEILNHFGKFLDFLKTEKIITSWKSINGFKMKFRGKNIGAISLGAPGWLNDAIHKKNYVGIGVETAERDDYDRYLEGQSSEIIDLFLERMENKCKHCRPTCGCSNWSWTYNVAGKNYENGCRNSLVYGFHNSDSEMNKMIMQSPCAVYPPISVRSVPIDIVKGLILARKAYINKI